MPPVTFFEYGARITGFLLVCLATRALIHYYLQLAVEVAVVGLSYYLPSGMKKPSIEETTVNERASISAGKEEIEIIEGVLNSLRLDCKEKRKEFEDLKNNQDRHYQNYPSMKKKPQQTEIRNVDTELQTAENALRNEKVELMKLELECSREATASERESLKKCEQKISQLKESQKIEELHLKEGYDNTQKSKETMQRLNEELCIKSFEIQQCRSAIKGQQDQLLLEYKALDELLQSKIDAYEAEHMSWWKYSLDECEYQYKKTCCIDELNRLKEERNYYRSKADDLKIVNWNQ